MGRSDYYQFVKMDQEQFNDLSMEKCKSRHVNSVKKAPIGQKNVQMNQNYRKTIAMKVSTHFGSYFDIFLKIILTVFLHWLHANLRFD